MVSVVPLSGRCHPSRCPATALIVRGLRLAAFRQVRTIERQRAIRDLRETLIELTDDTTSICEMAGRLGVFCRGHRRLSDAELAHEYDWIVERQQPRDRAHLEDLANRWQLARQSATDAELACDVQSEERDTCLGWDEFSNEELEQHYRALQKEGVKVI